MNTAILLHTDRRPAAERGAVLLALIALVGCAAAPLPDLKPALPAAWRHALPEQSAPTDLHGWWKNFHDGQLDALVDRALADNLDLAQAVERLRAARALHAQSGSQYLPYLAARTQDVIDPDVSASYFVAGFDAVWELGLFGRREGTRRVLQGELDDAAATLDSARVSMVGEVVADYLALGAGQERARLLKQVRDLRQQQLGLLRIRQELGLATDTQIAQAEGALARSSSVLLLALQQIDALAQQLAVLVGRTQPEPAWLISGSLPRLAAASIASAPADLLRTRPEIRRAEAQVLQAAGEADLAHADRMPNVAIGGSIFWSTNISGNRPASPSGIASIGPLLDIPLLDWGLRRARASANSHLLEAAVLAYRQAVLQGQAEVETALGNLQLQQDRERQQDLSLAAARRAADSEAQRVALTLDSPLDAQAAMLAQTEEQLALLNASADRGLAYVTLFKALGGAALPPLQGSH